MSATILQFPVRPRLIMRQARNAELAAFADPMATDPVADAALDRLAQLILEHRARDATRAAGRS